MHGGMEWMRHYEQFWSQRLDALDALLRADDGAARKPRKTRKTRSKR